MAPQESSLHVALGRIAPRDHLCSIYETAEERNAIAMPFLCIGIERGEKCIYIADEADEQGARDAMRAHGIDVDAAVARNALLVTTKERAYLHDGVFDPEKMFAFWKEAAREARAQGFSSARGIGETDWVAGGVPGFERWMEYESRLTDAVVDCHCSLLCQYNRRLFAPQVMRDVIRTHPLIVYRGAVCRNMYHVPAAEFLGPAAPEREVERLLQHVRERELNDAEAQAREVYLHYILESVTDNFFALDRHWKYTYMNTHGARQIQQLGKDPAKFVGTTLWEQFPEVPNAQSLRRVMNERVAITEELYYAPLGEWVENHIYPSHDGGIVVFQRYVTARKRDEEALRRSEALLSMGEKITRTGSWSWNASSGDLYWSPEHFRIFGFDGTAKAPPVEEVLGRLHPDDKPVWEEAFYSAVAKRANFEAKGRVIGPDGTIRHVRSMGRPMLDESGRVLEYVGVIMDTSEQKQAEEKLVASEQRFRQLAEAIPHHVWTFLAGGSVGYYNEQLVRYTGLSAAELKAGGWAALHPEDIERARAAWRHAWASGEPYELERRLRGRDGRYRRFLSRAVAVRDALGRIREWFGTDTDVEARHQAEEAVNQARAELAHVNRALTMGELTASIAHELNQPLAAVVTNANACERWLAAATPNIEEANESLRRITRDAMRASEVISRIRGLLTRRSTPKRQLRIDEVVRDVSLLVETEARAKNVQVQIISAQGLPAIVGDRVQLQQVVLNLVMNAIEAMSTVEGLRSLEVRAQAYGDGVQVSVQDSGTGVNPRIANRIFDAFFTTKAEGMGMGLPISRSIIEAHGGRLWASSNDRPGAIFQFTVPARPV